MDEAERFALTLTLTATLRPLVLIKQRLLLSGDVESNPGPLGQHTNGKALLLLHAPHIQI